MEAPDHLRRHVGRQPGKAGHCPHEHACRRGSDCEEGANADSSTINCLLSMLNATTSRNGYQRIPVFARCFFYGRCPQSSACLAQRGRETEPVETCISTTGQLPEAAVEHGINGPGSGRLLPVTGLRASGCAAELHGTASGHEASFACAVAGTFKLRLRPANGHPFIARGPFLLCSEVYHEASALRLTARAP